MAGFSKLGYLSIKRLLDKNSIIYNATTIKNSYDLLEKLSGLSLVPESSSIFGLDVVNMYPSISLDLIWEAVDYFSNDFDKTDKELLKISWDLAKLGMDNVIIKFHGKYYRENKPNYFYRKNA